MTLFIILYLLLSGFVFLKMAQNFYEQNKNNNERNELDRTSTEAILLTSSLGLLAFVIPFYRVSTSIPTIILSLLLLWYSHKYVKLEELKTILSKYYKSYSILLLAYFLIIFLHTVVFQGDYSKLSLALLPVVYFFAFLLIVERIPHAFHWLAQCFITGSALFIPFILGIGILRFNELSWDSFFYTHLLDPIQANPIIHAFYFNTALILTSYYLSKSEDYWKKIYYGILLFVFILMIILLGSKIGYIAAFSSMFFLGFFKLSKLLYKLSFVFLLTISLYLIFTQVPYINKRILGFKWQINQHELISLDHRLPRSVVWPEAVSLIKERPLKGYGFGRGFEILSTRYQAIGYTKGIENRFNAHNQFLESTLQLGIFGILWWTITLSYLIALAIKKRDPWLASFLFIAIAYLSVESLLESQMGTVGFSFFLAYFLFNALSKQSTSNKI